MSDERKWIASDGSELKPGMMVLVRGSELQNWTVSIFSHIEDGFFVCAGWKCGVDCIPLEGNEHMVGTTLPIPQKEKPFEWGERVLVWDRDGEEKKVAIFVWDDGDDYELRYDAFVKGDVKKTSWKHCERAPLDAAAENG